MKKGEPGMGRIAGFPLSGWSRSSSGPKGVSWGSGPPELILKLFNLVPEGVGFGQRPSPGTISLHAGFTITTV
jgi:hypothetical protein